VAEAVKTVTNSSPADLRASRKEGLHHPGIYLARENIGIIISHLGSRTEKKQRKPTENQ
jgi:hypothetical protein